MGPTKRTRSEVRARVLEPRHRRLQEGVDHLGLEVDEVAGKPGRARLGQATPGEALNVCQHEVLGGPVHGGVAHSAQWPRPGLERHPERCGVPAVEAYGMTPMAASAGRPRVDPRPREERRRTWSRTRCSRRRSRPGWPQVAALTRQRADEDPAQVVLHASHATFRRRLALGVGHHEVVGVVHLCKGDEARPGRQHSSAVVLGREEHDVVSFSHQSAGQSDSGAVWPWAGVVHRTKRRRVGPPAAASQPRPPRQRRPSSVDVMTAAPWWQRQPAFDGGTLGRARCSRPPSRPRRRGRCDIRHVERPQRCRPRAHRPTCPSAMAATGRADGQVVAGLPRHNGASAEVRERSRGRPAGRPRCMRRVGHREPRSNAGRRETSAWLGIPRHRRALGVAPLVDGPEAGAHGIEHVLSLHRPIDEPDLVTG